ncbi:MAG: DHA2 family efflux MFS transporter permease subunit [Acinetobacter sp.]
MNKSNPIAELTGGRLLLAAFVIALSNFMVVLDTTIANVSVTHISGDLAISTSQGTWVITSYAVAEAICVPLTGWLAGRFGSVRVFVMCLFGFTFFSLMCGLSNSLEMLVFCRIGQGLFGGPLMPISQALLMRIFPQEKHAQAMGLWAMTTVIGPILGPILGGWISDNLTWHWIFFINLPVGLICAFAALKMLKPAETPTEQLKIDSVGLGLLVLWIGALQLMLDLGHDRDWFNNPMILTLGLVAAIGFVVFLIWEFTDKHPVVDVRVFRHRGFTVSVTALAFGFAAFFGSIVIIPQWLQTNMGYTATWAGYLTAMMGFGSVTMSPVVAKLATKLDERALTCFGFLLMGAVTLLRAFWNNEADFMTLALPQILQGFAVPFFFIPLSNIALGSVLPNEIASAAGLMNFVRTMSGAIGTSLAVTLWDDHTKMSRSEIVANLNPEHTQQLLLQNGFSDKTALGTISNLVDKEALTMSVNHVFLLFAIVFIVSAIVIWFCPKPRKNAAAGHAAH